VGIGPSDAAFTHTTWWTVPLSGDAFSSWLRAHAPHLLRADSGSESVQSEGVWEHDLDFHAPGTTAHTRGWVNFAFMADGAGLVVRVDTFVGARFARTVLVPTDTTSVTIRRTEQSFRPHSRVHTTVRSISETGAVANLVEMVNGLPGAMTAPFVTSCPLSMRQRGYSITFAGPHGTYVASLPTADCWPQLTLIHDGTKVGPPIDPGRVFTKAADRCLR